MPTPCERPCTSSGLWTSATKPGTARAAASSSDTGCEASSGEADARRTRPKRMPGRRMSAAYSASPRTIAAPCSMGCVRADRTAAGANARSSPKGRARAGSTPGGCPAASASRSVAQAWASGTANSRIESLPTLAFTRRSMRVPCSRASTRSQGTPSSSQTMRFIAVSTFWPISTRGRVSV